MSSVKKNTSIKLLLALSVPLLGVQKLEANTFNPNLNFVKSLKLMNEMREVKGSVVDEYGNPIAKVKVTNINSSTIVYTENDGSFRINVDVNDELHFSKKGFFLEKRKINSFVSIDIVLVKEDDNLDGNAIYLNNVIAIGYKKLDANKAAGSYNQIDMTNFEKRGNSDIISSLEGLSSSLVLSSNPSDPTGSKELTIRGVSTLAGNAKPLIVVDGFQYEGNLESINPYEVENITLLKDAAASSIYGAKAANGVIVITTKKGKNGNIKIRYTNNLSFSQITDLKYMMNRVSSSDLIDIQSAFASQEVANGSISNYRNLMETSNPNSRHFANSNNRIYNLYSDLHFGYISQAEFDTQLAHLRNSDNTRDLEDTYLQNPFINQHNLSLTGGNENITYRTSLNYTNKKGNLKGQDSKRVLFDFISDIKINKQLSFDFQSNITLNSDKSIPLDYNGVGSIYSLDKILAIDSYERFYDEKRNPIPVIKPFDNNPFNGIYGGKDNFEIQRLIKAGLLDETYYPALDFNRYSASDNNWSVRVQGMLNYDFNSDFSFKFGGQLQKQSEITQSIANSDSWYMRQLVNNATPLNYSGDKRELNIPIGGRIQENRGESTSYLLRGQLDFDKTLDNHYVSVLLGSEIQAIKQEGTGVDRLGYDIKSKLFLPIDYKSLENDGLTEVYFPDGNSTYIFNNYFSEVENRFFSLYANAQYVYEKKYVITGSARVDQSNLFGTNPAYRYKPFWSLGGKWRIGQEDFLRDTGIDLDIRASYGFNGNIANDYGPFDIAEKNYVFRTGNLLGLEISGFKIPDLRWEQTATTNIGFDTRLIDKKLDLSFDYYKKNSRDILSSIEIDPTLGSKSVVRNDASIINNGYEITLNSNNITKDNFSWNTQLNFRYNQGEVKEVFFDTNAQKPYFYAGNRLNMKGHTPNSLFVFDYAGIDKDGNGVIRQANGNLVSIDRDANISIFTIDDLKNAGATSPIYVAGFNNNFLYNNFSLSFLFVYQGGHKLLKDSYNGEIISSLSRLARKDIARAWEKTGDENNTDIPKVSSALYPGIISGSSKNVIDGDFIKLRDIIFSYTLPSYLIKNISISELTISARASNLWSWVKNDENIDPESQGLGYRTFPTQKSFTLGFNIIF